MTPNAYYKQTSGFTTWQKASNILIRHPTIGSRNCNQSMGFGGSTNSGKYFAYPFSTGSSSISAKFLGISLNTTSGLKKISIYTVSSGVPGTSLGNITSITSNNYLDQVVDNSSCSSESNVSSHLTQAYFGENGISLSANTTYYVVLEFLNAIGLQLSRSNVNVSLPADRKYSSDLSSWTDWSGGGSGVYADNGAFFFIAN